MRTWKTFDFSEKAKFCEEHKKFFEEKVKSKVGRHDCINPSMLGRLLKKARYCTKCRWEVLFGR